jgi:transposase
MLINRWRRGGLEELVDKPKSGRPRKADNRYFQALKETIAKEPSELGYEFAI